MVSLPRAGVAALFVLGALLALCDAQWSAAETSCAGVHYACMNAPAWIKNDYCHLCSASSCRQCNTPWCLNNLQDCDTMGGTPSMGWMEGELSCAAEHYTCTNIKSTDPGKQKYCNSCANKTCNVDCGMYKWCDKNMMECKAA